MFHNRLTVVLCISMMLVGLPIPVGRMGSSQSSGEAGQALATPTPPPPQPEPGTCYPGTGWTWTGGPAQPETARQVEIALEEIGIQAAVSAHAFGERDSCGNFELSSTDFQVAPAGLAEASPAERQALSEQIRVVLPEFAGPQLGNVQIEWGAGSTEFYPSNAPAHMAENASAPSAENASAPAAELASSIGASSVTTKKVFLLVYNPTLSNGQDFNTYMGWTPYWTLVLGIIDSFEAASNGQIQYTVAHSQVANQWPVKVDGFRYTQAAYLSDYQNRTPHEPNAVNYEAIIDNPAFDICGRLNRGEIDELWIYGGPYDGFYESRLVGPGAYWYNSPPMSATHGCNRLLPIMGLNYERGVAEAMHSFGHRTESTLTRIYGSWQQNRTAHNWDRFGLVKSRSPGYTYSGCGNIHFPPNGTADYDYGNHNTVPTNCEDFRHYPNLGDPSTSTQPVTCTLWNCDHLGYLLYWYNHLPAYSGCGPDAVANNWWAYFADPNTALTPSLDCPPPPCPTVTAWKGEYWSNQSMLGSPVLCRNDVELDFDWGLGSPNPLIPSDHFSVRWTRTLNFNNGRYRFHMRHDDGARLYVDNVLKVEAWETCCVWDVVDVDLQSGPHTIRVEMFENSGAAHAELWWETIPGHTPPYAGFNAWPQNGNAPLTSYLSIVDTAGVTSCLWDYGDGQTGTSCAPSHAHTYTSEGTYRVSLTVNGPSGSDTMTQDDYIVVGPPSQVDLVPAPLEGRPAPIVISSAPGTGTNDGLIASRTIYIDWGYINTGNVDINTNYYVDLYIDNQRFIHYPFSWLGSGASGGFDDWSETWNTAGWHTAKLVVDPANTVSEANENNNVWTGQFYWEPGITQSISVSAGAQDGWILETRETGNKGDSVNVAAPTFNLGDDAAKKQYRGLLSFNTGAVLPDDAVVTSVTLKVKKQGITGVGNPLTMFKGFLVDIKKGTFGTAALQAGDFQAGGNSYGPFMPGLQDDWYSIDLTSAKAYINKFANSGGLTQFRLRFKLDDNNNKAANYVSLYSGNADAANRPQLIIQYYVP